MIKCKECDNEFNTNEINANGYCEKCQKERTKQYKKRMERLTEIANGCFNIQTNNRTKDNHPSL